MPTEIFEQIAIHSKYTIHQLVTYQNIYPVKCREETMPCYWCNFPYTSLNLEIQYMQYTVTFLKLEKKTENTLLQ